MTALALRCRRERPDLFARGGYVPVPATGPRADHVFAFLRTSGEGAALVVVPRLSAGGAEWGDTALSLPPEFAGAKWRNVFTGDAVEALNVGAVSARSRWRYWFGVSDRENRRKPSQVSRDRKGAGQPRSAKAVGPLPSGRGSLTTQETAERNTIRKG